MLIALLLIFTNTPVWSVPTQLVIVAYLAFHVGMDFLKNRLVDKKISRDSAGLFLLDQGFHLATIIALTWAFTRYRWSDVRVAVGWSETKQLHVLTVGVLYVAVIFGGGYLVRYLTHSLALQLPEAEGGDATELRNAGL